MFPLTAEKLYLAYGVFVAVLVLLNLVRMFAESSGMRQTRQAAATRRQSAAPKSSPAALTSAPVVAAPKRKPGRPRKTPAQSSAPSVAPAAPPAPVHAAAEDLPQPPAYLNPAVNPAHPQTGRANGNGAFVGQVVSFTGRLPHMTREQAIQAVQLNGGKAFKSMPRYTTILVVGDRPGVTKLDHADEWIDHIRKITPAQFNAMLTLPIRNA